jgi:hypothetical protein
MTTSENTDLYDRYLDGEMSNTESDAFIERLKTDNELKEDFFLHKAIRDTICDSRTRHIHKMLLEIKSNYNRKHNRRKLWIRISTVAASLLFVFFALQYWLFNEKTGGKELYEKYYSRAEHNPNTRGTVQEPSGNFDTYLMLYHKGQMNDALAGFSTVADTSELFLPAKYFAAHCHIQLNDYTLAIKELELVISQNESLFYYDALWYAGLCYLKINDNEKAKAYLTILANENSCYKEKAMSIISEL